MKICQSGHNFNFPVSEAEQLRIADKIVTVCIVIGKGDKYADIVQQGGVIQKLARNGRRAVHPQSSGAVEQLQRKFRHMKGMLFLKTAEAGKLEDTFLP